MDPPEETVEESLDPPEDGIVDSEEGAVPLKTSPPTNSLQTQVSQFWMLQALICTASSLKQDALAPKMASLVLLWLPPPQLAEHWVHSLQGMGASGQGHGSLLQLLATVLSSV